MMIWSAYCRRNLLLGGNQIKDQGFGGELNTLEGFGMIMLHMRPHRWSFMDCADALKQYGLFVFLHV